MGFGTTSERARARSMAYKSVKAIKIEKPKVTSYLLRDACRAGRVAEVRSLIARGRDVNEQLGGGRTALHEAAWYGQAKVARVLLNAHADPNITQNEGFSPLWLAAFKGHADIVKLLLDAGADKNLESRLLGNTAFKVVCGSPEADKEAAAQIKKMIKKARLLNTKKPRRGLLGRVCKMFFGGLAGQDDPPEEKPENSDSDSDLDDSDDSGDEDGDEDGDEAGDEDGDEDCDDSEYMGEVQVHPEVEAESGDDDDEAASPAQQYHVEVAIGGIPSETSDVAKRVG